ncbi:flagellin N-terminal helical domain-containing protein [Aureimonas sp. D3]|uniref:flagellin N-terminal helical domain-containing protein n=1 Tax=Aureimonas sp. D3 TaxID=1638164 RepID=UPI000A8AE364|nr:flagellin [Aureimonas sp. D3]
MTSVNTNIAAMTALRNLQATQSLLEGTQNRISTGFKINDAKDNAAYWSIATTLRSDNKSLSTVKDALGLGSATVDTAYQGLNKAKDVLDEIKSKLTAASQDGVDRSKIQAEIAELQKQLKSIAASSTFSGENWLSVDSASPSYNANKSVVASMSRDQKGAVTIGTIDVDTSAVKLFDANANADGIADSRLSLTTATGAALNVGGFVSAAPPSIAGLGFTGTATGSAGTTAAGAVATLGTLNMAAVTKGDVITFSLTVDGTNNTVRLKTSDLAADGSDFVSKLQLAVTSAVGAGKVTVSAPSNVVTLTAGSVGTASQITVGAVTTVNGDGAVTDTAGILTAGALPAPAFGSSFGAVAKMNTTAYTAPTAAGGAIASTAIGTVTSVGSDGTMTFDITYNGVTKTGITTGTITKDASAATQAGNMKLAMQTAIDTAFANTVSTQNGRVYTAGDITVGGTGANLTITTANKGSAETVKIGNLSGTGGFAAASNAVAGLAVAGVTATGTGQGAGIVAGDTYSFNVQYGSTVKQISHTFAASDFVVSGGVAGIASGWTTKGQPTAAEWATFLQTKIDTAFTGTGFNGNDASGNPIGAVYSASNHDITVTQTGGMFELSTRNKGANMAVGISSVSGSIYGVTTGAGSRLGLDANSTSYYYDATNTKTLGSGTVGYGKDSQPLLDIGTFSDTNLLANDTISLSVNLGGTQKTISISTAGMLAAGNTNANAATFQTKVQNALDSAFGTGPNNTKLVTFLAQDSNNSNHMTIKATAAGSTSYIAVSNVTAQDGDNVTSSTAGLTAGATNTGLTANGTNVAAASTAVLASTGAFTGPLTFGVNDSITLNLSVDGNAKSVTIAQSDVKAALSGAATINTATDYAAVLNAAFTAGNVGVTVTAPSNVLTFTRAGGAGAGSVQVTSVTPSGGASTMSVDKIDVSDATLSTLNVTSANRKDVLSAYISLVNTAINKVSSAASSLGSVASRIQMQQSFVNTLMDTIDKGVSNLVDADLSEESTKLQALQTKSQLGMQALSIANQSAQSILALFRG